MSPQTIAHPRSPEATEHPLTKPVVAAPERRRRGRLVERAAGVVAIAAIIGGGVLLANATDDDQPSFRTAQATTRTVSSTLNGVATIEPVDQAAVGFPTAGTVSTVDVAVGDTVTTGQQLATLDTLELERDLRDKEASLAQAELVLAVALDGDDPSSVAQSSNQTPMGFASAAVTADTASASDVDPQIAAAQQAVISAQQASSVALATAAATLDSAIAICGTVATATDPTAAIGACQTALTAVTSAQQDVAAAQDAVTAAASALDALLSDWATELESTPTPQTPTTEPTQPATTEPSIPSVNTPATTEPTTGESPGGIGSTVDITGGSGRSGAPASGGPSTVTNTPSSQDLIAYQYDVDAARFEVQAAEQALAQAVIVSPITGTVASVDLTVGDTVAAASTTQTIVIEGTDGYEATTTVSINDIADIRLTQKATITPDGSTGPIDGTVVAIAPTPDPASSTTTYRVTIGFADPATATSPALRNGNIGTVSITTGIATDSVSVPTSAVTLDGEQHVVTIIGADGVATPTPVTIGIVGNEWTEVTNGLDVGDTVTLADLGEPLPGSATDVDTDTQGSSAFEPGGNFQFSGTPPIFGNGPGG